MDEGDIGKEMNLTAFNPKTPYKNERYERKKEERKKEKGKLNKLS